MLTESTNNLTYEKLSKEEMAQRGILGRLVGICADFASPTRNGRKYPEKLWENIFNSDIMKERIANGVCFGELGHPSDREETDPEKICICMPEEPKKGPDGKLRAVFDILDTPNGRILKSLCDYGSKLGISSRGSGDLEVGFDGQESVNPDTYNCEGFDIVLLPGVKEARLQYVNESLDKTRYNKTLRQRIQESIDKETDANKKVMQESLDTLGIKLNESTTEVWNKIPQILTEALSAADKMDLWHNGQRRENIKACGDAKLYTYRNICEVKGYTKEVSIIDAELRRRGNTVPTDKVVDEEPTGKDIFKFDPDKQAILVKECNDGIKFLRDVRGENFEDITTFADGWYEIARDEDDSETVARALIKYVQSLDEELDMDMKDESLDIDTEVQVADDNDMAMVNELQEALKLNKKLDEKIVTLQERLSACYAKEMELEESIDNYKMKIAKLSNKSKENKALTEKLSKLENELKESNSQIADKKNTLHETMQRDAKERKSLKESLASKDRQIKQLTEKLEKTNKEFTEKFNRISKEVSATNEDVRNLNEQLETARKDNRQLKEKYSKKLDQSNQLIEKYKKIAKNAVDKYINRQATILGITPHEIKNRLPESYSFKDIDTICESLREYRVNMNSLPFDTKLNESINFNVKNVSNKVLAKRNDEDELSDADIKLAEKFMK